MISHAERLTRLPPYIFADLERMQVEMTKKGVDIISLGIGDPDLPPPRIVIESIKEALNEAGSNNYPSSAGEDYFREAVADWYSQRFNVTVDPDKEVCALIGSKEGLANIGRALLNPGDRVLLPDPGYPVYGQGATLLSDAIPVVFPLRPEMGFQPDFSEIRTDKKTKLLFLNYPCNPTAAVAGKDTLDDTLEFCRKHELVLCYDNAYSEISFDSYRSPSALQVDSSLERTVEFNSCSKMFNMTGYRVGFAVGNRDMITALKKVKAQIDSGLPKFIQKAAATALGRYFDVDLREELKKNNQIFKQRLEILAEGLRRIGFEASVPKATFYLWLNTATDGGKFVRELLAVGVVATPGGAFGESGTNYVRFSLTQPTERIVEAVKRIENVKRPET